MAEAEAPPNPNRNSPFATAFRGYDQAQVDEYVKKLSDELAAAAKHRDEASASVTELTKALSYAQTELADAKAALTRMVEDPAGPAAMTERVKTMMQLAEDEISELRTKAEQEAAATREAADSYADKTRQKAQEEAERLGEEAKQRRDALDKDAEERRTTLQRETEEELAAKRAEAEQAAEELRRDAEQRADTMIAEAERKLADAEHKRTEALQLREKVAERLAASHLALREAIDRLGPEPESAEQEQESQKQPA